MGLYRTGMSSSGGGGTITVDDQLSTTSENPVQNKVITNALNNKQPELTAGTGISIDSSTNTISIDSSSMGGYQRFITSSFQTPSGGSNGDIDLSYNNLVTPSNDTFRRTFRKEDGSWKRLRPYAYGTDQELNSIFTEGTQDGDLAIENDGTKITKIKQYIGSVSGDWLELSVTTSTTDITAGTTPLNDGAIYLVYE